MSHWEKVKAEVTDLDILQSACEELGATVKRNAIARGWSTSGRNDQTVPLSISIPNCRFDIAVKEATNSETGEKFYEMEADWYDGKLRSFFGKEGSNVGKILEMYLVHKAEGCCRAQRKPWERVDQGTHIDVVVTV